MQAVPSFGMVNWIVLAAFFLLVVTAIRWFFDGARRREQNHAARMKALEMGQPDPAINSLWPRACTCIAIGGCVPVGLFFFAWMASRGLGTDPAVQAPIWAFAFVTSLVAVGCGTGLASSLLRADRRRRDPQPGGKPAAYDPEAFEPEQHVY